MTGRILFTVLVVLVIVGAVVGIGSYAYNIGVSQGLAESGKLVSPATGGAPAPFVGPYPYYGGFGLYRPFGFGFGFFGCLFPLLFFFLIFGLFRGIFWRGHWGGPWKYGGWRGNEERGVPPHIDELHRRMHEQSASNPPAANPPAGEKS